jgi:hypothetical protein
MLIERQVLPLNTPARSAGTRPCRTNASHDLAVQVIANQILASDRLSAELDHYIVSGV